MGAGRRLRLALSALTRRGRAFLGVAVACALAAVLLGERDLLRVAVLLAALPLVCLAALSRTRYRLRCLRTAEPLRLTPGATSRVSLRLENLGRLPTAALVAEDTVPFVLGPRPRFALTRLPAGSARTAAYTVRSDTRGRFRLGPLTVRLRDPFGCCELSRSFTAYTDIVVTPPVVSLPAAPLHGVWSGLGEEGAAGAGTAGEDDATVRDYRRGDDLRRIHWASTARVGSLMVRREAAPWSASATVVLDDRAGAHHGSGAGSSFERAVSVTASVVAHLSGRGLGVGLATLSGATAADPDPELALLVMLDLLADVGLRREAAPASQASALTAAAGRSSLVAVLGALEPADVRLFAALPGTSVPHLAVLLDTPSWVGQSGAARAANRRRTEAAGETLERAGWHTVVAEPEDTIPQLWRTLTTPALVGAP